VLIVSADDLGRSEGINAGIQRAHQQGIVRSAGLMVRWPAAEEAAEAAVSNGLDLGLHVELGEWAYVDRRWQAVHEVVDIDRPDAVEVEIRQQLDRFRELVGRDPTHLDSHQHVHLWPPATTVFAKLADELGVPLRSRAPEIAYNGDFYGKDTAGVPYHDAISVDGLIQIVGRLGAGVTELGCHPGLGDDSNSEYGRERELEVGTLCDPRVLETIEAWHMQLRSFADLRQTASQ
jgi:chitin disaccharide deacetylase